MFGASSLRLLASALVACGYMLSLMKTPLNVNAVQSGSSSAGSGAGRREIACGLKGVPLCSAQQRRPQSSMGSTEVQWHPGAQLFGLRM
jgi:hypothetical protein